MYQKKALKRILSHIFTRIGLKIRSYRFWVFILFVDVYFVLVLMFNMFKWIEWTAMFIEARDFKLIVVNSIFVYTSTCFNFNTYLFVL